MSNNWRSFADGNRPPPRSLLELVEELRLVGETRTSPRRKGFEGHDPRVVLARGLLRQLGAAEETAVFIGDLLVAAAQGTYKVLRTSSDGVITEVWRGTDPRHYTGGLGAFEDETDETPGATCFREMVKVL